MDPFIQNDYHEKDLIVTSLIMKKSFYGNTFHI